jgi:hypothetical protein
MDRFHKDSFYRDHTPRDLIAYTFTVQITETEKQQKLKQYGANKNEDICQDAGENILLYVISILLISPRRFLKNRNLKKYFQHSLHAISTSPCAM